MGSPSLMEFAEPEALLQAIFEFQCLLRGEPKARDIFRRAMHRSPKKRGENREIISGETLLVMYDGFVANNPGTPPFTKAEAPGAFAMFAHIFRPTNAVAAKRIGTLSQSAGASAQAI